VEQDGGAASLPEVDIHDCRPSPTGATMIDMRHGPLPTQDNAKWQLDFLGRWKAKKYFIYSEGTIELYGYPLVHAEGKSGD
jgi:hypothetical protein